MVIYRATTTRTYFLAIRVNEALSQDGFSVKSISTFSTAGFLEKKEDYLIEYYGEEAGRVSIQNSDIPTILEEAKKFLGSHNSESIERVPTLDDIKDLLTQGWYVMPVVNSKQLNSLPGYTGHFILIYGYDSDGIICHDRGLPPRAAREVSWQQFEEAWSSAQKDSRALSAYRALQPSHENQLPASLG
jgi:hypothetical protein